MTAPETKLPELPDGMRWRANVTPTTVRVELVMGEDERHHAMAWQEEQTDDWTAGRCDLTDRIQRLAQGIWERVHSAIAASRDLGIEVNYR